MTMSSAAPPSEETGKAATAANLPRSVRSWFRRAPSTRTTTQAAARSREANPLMAFAAEGAAADAPAPEPRVAGAVRQRPQILRTPVSAVTFVLVAVGAAIGAATLVYARWDRLLAAERRQGRITVDTRPAGAAISIDGLERGKTPITLSLDAGPHTLMLRRGADTRVIPVTLAAGAQLGQYVELSSPVVVQTTGRVSIATDPPGARVRIDGEVRGTAPLTVSDLAAAEHKITVTGENGSADRTITIEPGATTSLVFSLPRTSMPAAGWVHVSAPFDIQLLEGTSIVGTGRAAKLMMPAGRHDLEVVNEALDFRESRSVEVSTGKVTTIKVDAPKGIVSANARPWADVIIDGTNVGQTPIANLSLTIGPHQVLFRHPQYGERTQTVVVTARGVNRVAVDFTK
jgi:hypothetical protein